MNQLWRGFLSVQDGREPVETDVFLSQTTINNALLCGGRVLYRDHEGYDFTPSEAMSFGTMVHGMAEADLGLLGLPVCGQWSKAAVEEIWRQGLLDERDGSWDLDVLASRERIDKSVREAMVANRKWHEQVVPNLGISVGERMLIEQRVTKQLGTLDDGRAVWLGGTSDVVFPDVPEIVDWKTAGRGWDESKAQFTIQATIYTWLYEIPNHTYWVWNRRNKDWSSYTTRRNEQHVDSALRQAWQVAGQIATGTLTASPLQDTFGKVKRGWHCSAKFCGAWNICEFNKLPDDVWEGQRIDPKVGWE